MKTLLIGLLLYSSSCTANSDSTFEYHFRILDSAAKANPKDTAYHCCTPSIKFMEVNTGIESKADGTLLGKLYFTKEDLDKWHKWYNKKIW